MARKNPSTLLSVTRPCRSARGAQAIEWMTKSSPPSYATASCTSLSSAPSCCTSQVSRGMFRPVAAGVA